MQPLRHENAPCDAQGNRVKILHRAQAQYVLAVVQGGGPEQGVYLGEEDQSSGVISMVEQVGTLEAGQALLAREGL